MISDFHGNFILFAFLSNINVVHIIYANVHYFHHTWPHCLLASSLCDELKMPIEGSLMVKSEIFVKSTWETMKIIPKHPRTPQKPISGPQTPPIVSKPDMECMFFL